MRARAGRTSSLYLFPVVLQLVACGGGDRPLPTTGTPPTITSDARVAFYEGVPDTFQIVATGDPRPVLIVQGDLSTGLVFDPATNTIRGTAGPRTHGDHALTITATNGVAPSATQGFTLTVLTDSRVFGLLTRTDLLYAAMDNSTIDASEDNNKLPAGTIVLYSTRSRLLGKMLITRYGSHLVFDCFTFRSDGREYASGTGVMVEDTCFANLEECIPALDWNADFRWQQTDATHRALVPMGGAIFAVYH